MTVDDLALIPLFVGVVAMLVTSILSNRRKGESRRRTFAIGSLISLSGVLGGILVLWVPKIFVPEGAAWIVPAVLATVIVVVAFFFAAAGLKPRSETASTQFAESRRYGHLIAVVAGSLVVLALYGAGFFLGSLVDQALGGELRIVLSLVGVAIALAAFTPVIALKVLAARRRVRVAGGHPASDEVAEHAMRLAAKSEMKALDYAFDSPARRVIFYVVAFVAVTLVPLFTNYALSMVPDSSPERLDLSILYIATGLLGFAVAVIAVLDFFVRPSLLDARHEYELAALSDEERLRIRSRDDADTEHRFPSRLTNPNRSIRVLALTGDGTASLEYVATSTLLYAQSGEFVAEALVDADLDGVPQDIADASIRVVQRLGNADLAAMGLSGFDGFEARDGQTMYVVARTDDDYSDFPEDLGAEIAGGATP